MPAFFAACNLQGALFALGKCAGPVIRWGKRGGVRDIGALPKLADLALAVAVFDYSEDGVGEVQIFLEKRMVAALPSEPVDETTLVTVGVGYRHGVDGTMLERCEVLADSGVEVVIELKEAVMVEVSVVEGSLDVGGEGCSEDLIPRAICRVGKEAYIWSH